MQLTPPDSLAPGFLCVAIDRAGGAKPVGVPPDHLRWVNPAEAAPPARGQLAGHPGHHHRGPALARGARCRPERTSG